MIKLRLLVDFPQTYAQTDIWLVLNIVARIYLPLRLILHSLSRAKDFVWLFTLERENKANADGQTNRQIQGEHKLIDGLLFK